MKVTYADSHLWVKQISADPLENYGKSDRKRIKKAIETIDTAGISYSFAPVDTTFFEWFTPLYSASLQEKNSTRIHDVAAKTIGVTDSKLQYKTLTIYQNSQPVGGCIFSDRPNRYSIAYRMFQKQWKHTTIGASPALLGEYLLDCYCQETEKQKLLHGQDRNPYGINSSIGVANFKLAVGCIPKLPSKYTLLETDVHTLQQDTLIFTPPTREDSVITNATLVLTTGSVEQYSQLLSYADRITITVINV